VSKFKTDTAGVSRALADDDPFRDFLQGMVLRDIRDLLASVGVRTFLAAPTPLPPAVNVEVGPPSYSDFDEDIP